MVCQKLQNGRDCRIQNLDYASKFELHFLKLHIPELTLLGFFSGTPAFNQNLENVGLSTGLQSQAEQIEEHVDISGPQNPQNGATA